MLISTECAKTPISLAGAEVMELQYCLRENARYCWDYMMIDNQFKLASATHDHAWQLELQRKLEVLRLTGRIPKI